MRVAATAIGKLLLLSAAIIGSVQIFRLFLLPEIQSAFLLGDTLTSAVRRAGILLCAVLAYWGVVRLTERRAVVELHVAPGAIALGAMTGAALISITTLSLFATGIYQVTGMRGFQAELAGVAGLIFVAAVLEEITYRCVLFRLLEEAWGTLPALWLQSLIFAVMHLGNIEGADPVAAVTTVISGTLIGAFWTLVFVHSRNLWVVGANHAAWNFSIILTGLPLSGLEDWRSLAPIESRYNGPDWLTGGVFGPEDSLITIGVMCVSIVLLLAAAYKRNRITTGSAQTA